MTRILINIMLFFCATSMAQTTTDRITASVESALLPGGEADVVLVSLDATEHDYTGYQMNIALPEGIEPDVEEGVLSIAMCEDGADGLYPCSYNKMTKKYIYTHSVSGVYDKETRVIRVTCFSSANEAFTKRQGGLFMILLSASTYVKPGDVSLPLSSEPQNETKLITYDAVTQATTGYTVSQTAIESVTVGTEATTSLSVSSSNKWSTCILPFATAIPEGVKVYSCASKDDEQKVFNLTEVTAMEAYKPYVLYSESGYTGSLTGTVDASAYPASGKVTAGLLSGAIMKQTTSEGYIMQKQNGTVKFYKADPSKTYTIPAGKCWATPASSLESYSFRVIDVTGIKQTEGEQIGTEKMIAIDGKEIKSLRSGQLYKKISK